MHGFVRTPNGPFTTIDAPGAATGTGLGTFALRINALGAVTGYYLDAAYAGHGFVATK